MEQPNVVRTSELLNNPVDIVINHFNTNVINNLVDEIIDKNTTPCCLVKPITVVENNRCKPMDVHPDTQTQKAMNIKSYFILYKTVSHFCELHF